MDGVLFKTINYARQKFLEKHPGVTEEMYNDIHTGNYHKGAEKYAHLKIQETPQEEKDRQNRYWVQKTATPLVGGMHDLLQFLRDNNFVITLNTNAKESNCVPLLQKSGAYDFFDFITTSNTTRDKVEKFKIIKDRYNVESDECFFVTDALGDVRDSGIVAIPTVAVTWGVHGRMYFNQSEHSHLIAVVDTVSELRGVIDNHYGKMTT